MYGDIKQLIILLLIMIDYEIQRTAEMTVSDDRTGVGFSGISGMLLNLSFKTHP